MITINNTPPFLSPVYNPIVLKLGSDSRTQPDFRIITTITSGGGNVSNLKTAITPDGYAYVDLHRHLESLVSSHFNPNDAYFNIATQSYATYSVSVREQFGITQSSPVIAITNSVAFNGVFNFDEFPEYDQADYLPNFTTPKQFLTNVPDGYEIDINSSMFINVFQKDINSVAFMSVRTNKGLFEIPNAYKTMPNTLFSVACGPKQLLSHTASIIPDGGTFPIVDENTTTIEYTIYNTADNKTIQTKTLNLVNKCYIYDKVQILFMDKLGSYVPFTFNMVNRHTKNLTKTEYSKNVGYYYNTLDRTRTTLNTNIVDNYILNSDWIKQTTSDYLIEMLESPNVYAYLNNKWLPIIITTNTFEKKQTINDDLINLTITFELTNNSKTQRG